MRYCGIVLAMLFTICTSAWGQNTLSFVSTLYTPNALFEEVETRANEVTSIPANTTFNVGSVASGGGTISIQGGPISVHTLSMDNNTAISDDGDDRRWLVDTLEIGPQGTVEIGTLIAGTVSLLNSKFTTTSMGAGNLSIDNSTWAVTGAATTRLTAYNTSGTSSFHFEVGTGAALGSATWRVLPNTTINESDKEISSDLYPIFSDD